MATGAMRSTPTKALEVITSTIPIETKIKSTAILAYNRLKKAGTNMERRHDSKWTHRDRIYLQKSSGT